MDVRNCKRCGKMYNHISGPPVCLDCKRELEEQFKITRIYIRKNPNASIAEIAKECGVDVRQIREWIREERLSFSSDSEIGIDCEMCGTTIKSGRFCKSCKEELVSGIEKHTKKKVQLVEDSKKDSKSNKMRFLNKENKF